MELVYDVTDKKTLDNVDYWVNNIEKHATTDVQKLLVANWQFIGREGEEA